MAGKVLVSRTPKRILKVITFTGAAGLGGLGTNVTLATVVGRVLIRHLVLFCTTDLVAAGGTVGLKGLAGATIIAATSTNDINVNRFWIDQTPEPESSASIKDLAMSANLIIEPLTTAVSAGAFEVSIYWTPLSLGGNLT